MAAASGELPQDKRQVAARQAASCCKTSGRWHRTSGGSARVMDSTLRITRVRSAVKPKALLERQGELIRTPPEDWREKHRSRGSAPPPPGRRLGAGCTRAGA